MATASLAQPEYDVTESDRTPGLLLPQRVGRVLWAPMLGVAVVAFMIAAVLGIIRGTLVADGGSPDTAALLAQFTTGVMFIGFASVFSAIVFAIARILGTLRTGGSDIQVAAGVKVKTLKMPGTGKLMIVLMMMAMMGLMFAVITHFVLGIVVAGAINDGNTSTIDTVGDWNIWMDGVRRFSATVYLVSIALGLATIVRVLRFQAARIRELPQEKAGA